MTSGSRTWLGSVTSAPSDCNWKMTSFSDFPILLAMSLTRIFAAAIQSPGFLSYSVAELLGGPAASNQATLATSLLHFRLFRLFLARLRFRGHRLSFLPFPFLGVRRLLHFLVLAGDLDDLRRRLGIDAFDGRQIVNRRIDHRVEIVVAGRVELVSPFPAHLVDVVHDCPGARLGHRFLEHGAERIGHFAFDL